MFEKAARQIDLTRIFSEQPRKRRAAGKQMPRDDKVDPARPRRTPRKGRDHDRVDEWHSSSSRSRRAAPALACAISAAICSRMRFLQIDRRDRHALEIHGLGVTGFMKIEDARNVARNGRLGGEE